MEVPRLVGKVEAEDVYERMADVPYQGISHALERCCSKGGEGSGDISQVFSSYHRHPVRKAENKPRNLGPAKGLRRTARALTHSRDSARTIDSQSKHLGLAPFAVSRICCQVLRQSTRVDPSLEVEPHSIRRDVEAVA